MKKLLTILICLGLCFGITNKVLAAIPATTVWEVRTTGASTNGGGFNSARGGTDYSQQDAAQLSLTDLAMTTGGTTLTSATGGFTDAMKGNLIYIASGTNFTAGYYEIVSVTDTNTVTLDRDATDGTNGLSGSGKVGGALDSFTNIQGTITSGNIIYIKSGTYTESWSIATGGGSSYTRTKIIGYNSTRDDYPTGSNRPVIDGTGNSNVVTTSARVDMLAFYNLIFQNSSSDVFTRTSYSSYWYVENCRMTGGGGWGCNSLSVRQFFFCEFDNNASGGANVVTSYYYCYAHDNSGPGIYRGGTVEFCIADSNSGNGISVGNVFSCSGNVSYNNTGASTDGIVFTWTGSGYDANTAYNNIAVSNGRYGINAGLICVFFDYNCYYGNGTAGLNGLTAGSHDVTSDPLLNDPANGDFSLQSGSPAKDAGFPASSMAGATI